MGVLTLGAGVAVLAGTFLPWVKIEPSGVTFQGGSVPVELAGLDQRVYAAVARGTGAVLCLCGIVWLLFRTRRPAAWLAVVAGAGAAGLGIFVLVDLQSAFIDLAVAKAASQALPAPKVESLLSQLVANETLSVQFGTGPLVVAIGGGVGLLLGLIGGFARVRLRSADGEISAAA